MGIFGFLFFLLDIYIFFIYIEQLAKYRFWYKARFNTSSWWSYLHFGELCECGFHDRLLFLYFLRRKSSTYLKLDFNGVHFRDVFTKILCLNGYKYLESKRLHHLCDCGIRVFTLLFVSTSIKRSMLM